MIKRILIFASLFILTACGAGEDSTETVIPQVEFSASQSFQVALSGKQEVPMSGSTEMATATIQIDETLKQVKATLDASNITGVTAAHIHAGRIGQNGDPLFTFEDAGDGMFEIDATDISSSDITALMAAGLYINVHSEMYPSGAVRGQIVNATTSFIGFKLSGSQEVPAVATNAMGYGYATYDSKATELELRAVTMNAEGATGAHIHTGDIGTNGDVLVALVQDTADMNTWATPEDTMIDADTLAVLMSGGHYVNVHTESVASGEIRGQILTDNFVLSTFKLQGSQEVPAVDIDAMGDGYALINMDNYSVDLKVVTMGVSDATGAHIHTGRIGSNGGVLVALEQSMDDDNVWMSPDGLMIDEDIFAELASGGHYVNIHTPDVASGAIRGQIVTDNFMVATFNLNGDQEVPSITTNAMGSGYALLNNMNYGIELKIVTSGITDASGAHIHAGRIGNNGGVVSALIQSETDSNVWMSEENLMVDADTFAELLSGGHYVNVHSPSFASGQIRGQILTDYYSLMTFSLNGQQEAPAVATVAMGDGYALVNTMNYAVELQVNTSGVSDATAAHIHTGRPGENGAVLAALMQSESDANIWMAADDLMIDADIYATMMSGGHYVNVHTPTFASGEIRGQILSDNYFLATFELTGSQENPAVVTTASGDGYVLVNKDDYAIEARIMTEGMTPTGAHIHTGNVGDNGPVLLALVQDVTDTALWLAPVGAAIDAEIFAELTAGGHYVNVHSATHASGEIRGQIE